MRKSCQIFHDRSLLVRYFWSFVLPVLEYCSVVWCSAADSHLKLLDRVVSSANFLVVYALENNFAHQRSVAVSCTLCKMKRTPVPPFSGPLPSPSVPAHVTRGASVAHRHSFAPPSCRTSQYRRAIVLHSVSQWNDLNGLVFDGVGLASFRSRANAF